MNSRFWFYSASLIIICGLFVWRSATVNALNNELTEIDQSSLVERKNNIQKYVEAETDERKLISLAKRLKHTETAILEIIILRAYTLNPDSRDIVLLASQFRPELKEQVTKLDPLYEK